MENVAQRAVSAWPWSRLALVSTLAAAVLGPGAAACPAAFIFSTTPLGGSVLQLPEVASTRELTVIDPETGVSIFVEGDNLFGARSATDRLVRVPGSTDLEGFTFTFSNPDVYTGVTLRDVGIVSGVPPDVINVLVIATDQFGLSTIRHFGFPSTFTVSILGTGGSTLRSLQVGTPGIGSGLGPIELQSVPEPSSLALAASGGLAVLGHAWRRRRGAAVAGPPPSRPCHRG